MALVYSAPFMLASLFGIFTQLVPINGSKSKIYLLLASVSYVVYMFLIAIIFFFDLLSASSNK